MKLTWLSTRPRAVLPAVVAVLVGLASFGCGDREAAQVILTADVPLHLEDHLDAATIEGSEIPTDVPEALEWRFDEPQPEWKPVGYAESTPVRVTRLDDALRVDITEANYRTGQTGNISYDGWIYVDLPDLRPEDWGYVSVRARAQPGVRGVGLWLNPTDRSDPSQTPDSEYEPAGGWPLKYFADEAPLITDGLVHTYLLRVGSEEDWDEPWKQIGLRIFAGSQPGRVPTSIDILLVSLIPKEAAYADADVGVAHAFSGNIQRRELYTHAPARLEYRVRVPDGGRFDVGLGVVRDDVPVNFAITAQPLGGDAVTLLEETYSDSERWGQRSLDLTRFEGEEVSLVLTATSDRPGTVARWVAPTISGSRNTPKPNVIFYIIDSAGADFMSVYGYNRRTTPYIAQLAAEGAVFENAYSNSSYTSPSTRSFVTSLHDSALRGTGGRGLPEQAMTMAQHMRVGGYQTAMFTSNPNAGSATDRGVGTYRDAYPGVNSTSSVELHRDYWNWRSASPGEPYWAHFQTTDVHWPFRPAAPFAGLFISPELRETYYRWDSQLRSAGGFRARNFDGAGVDRVAHAHAEQGLYDETMAHNDYQIGRLVERLKAAGEWEHTILIVASDHGYPGASPRRLDPMPPTGEWALLRPHVTRIPLIVVWPERIAPGQRFSDPVSMIDLLPTILDLAGLPMPEIMQGQSLAPLLLGTDGWEPRPVILDDFDVDPQTGELRGLIEVIDGRWGASLEINPDPEGPPEERRPAPLLLYDLWNDPHALSSLHEEWPDLVEHYTAFLEAQWEVHQALAQQFTPSEESPLTAEQLRTLRSLGYIR